jgi:hypothetical protein
MTARLTTKRGVYYIVCDQWIDGERKQSVKSTGLPEMGNKRKAEKMLRDFIAENSTPPENTVQELLLEIKAQQTEILNILRGERKL